MASRKSIRHRQRYAEDPEYRERKLARDRRYVAAHKDVLNERRRLKWRTDPEYRVRDRLCRHGLSREDYQGLLARQGGACAICRSKHPLDIDHCHSTRQVRGLLCRKCNLGLGLFDDDIDRMLAAIAYLEISRRPLGKSGGGRAIAVEIVERLHRRLKLAVRAAFALRGRRRGGQRLGGERGSRERRPAGTGRGSRKVTGRRR
jgi:Recombination endonuclease VII